MDFKIDKNGLLWAERAGKMKKQHCLHADGFCGDHCPLFGEPVEVMQKSYSPSGLNPISTGRHNLNLCRGMIDGKLTDERVGQ